MQYEELKDRLVAHYDPDEIVDILGISTEELVDCLQFYLEENPLKLYRFVEFDESIEESYQQDV